MLTKKQRVITLDFDCSLIVCYIERMKDLSVVFPNHDIFEPPAIFDDVQMMTK